MTKKGYSMTTNLMVFIAGDNNLDKYGTADIEEMMSVENTGDELTILVQQDQAFNARDSGTKRFVIRNGMKESIVHMGETNTGDSNTLTEFLKWGMENYEAERNIVVLWNHGGGTRDELYDKYDNNETAATMRSVVVNPTLGNQPSMFPEAQRMKLVNKLMQEYQVERGEPTRSISDVESRSILFDDEARDFLDNLELKQVFVDLDKKVDIIGFDACLMSMMEVAYQLRDYAEVIVGSEELEPEKGWDYAAVVSFLVENPNASNEEISKLIIESFIDSYADREELKVTLSALRTKNLTDVACRMNSFAHTILRKESRIRRTFLSIVDDAQTFDYENNEQIYRDLKHFILLTKDNYMDDEEIVEASDALLKSLDTLLIQNKTNNFTNAHGLSVYLPLMPNMSGFAINVFSALDINAKSEAPYWLKLFKQIGNLDREANDILGAEALDSCVEEAIVIDEVIIDEGEREEYVVEDNYAGLYLITSFIKEGRKDEFAVKQLQALLNVLGERLVVDGDFGRKSTIAVKNFQSAQGLTADGLVGEQSWYKLYEVALAQSLEEENSMYELLSLSSNNRELVLFAQSLLYLLDRTTLSTGKYDASMEEQVTLFQMTMDIDINACIDDVTWSKLFARVAVAISNVDAMLLKDDFISQKALENDLSPAAVKAVVKVESRGRGFNREKQPLILFEGHIFWRELVRAGLDPEALMFGNEDIIYKHFNYKYYNRAQYPRLEKAKNIDEEAALKSASYGMFQVMGFNYKLAGFDNVREFVEFINHSEENQLEAFFNYIKNRKGCFEALQAKNWAKFAKLYNGPGYRENQYDTKLKNNYNSSKLAKGIQGVMDEEKFTSLYALDLEKAFYELEDE